MSHVTIMSGLSLGCLWFGFKLSPYCGWFESHREYSAYFYAFSYLFQVIREVIDIHSGELGRIWQEVKDEEFKASQQSSHRSHVWFQCSESLSYLTEAAQNNWYWFYVGFWLQRGIWERPLRIRRVTWVSCQLPRRAWAQTAPQK